MTALHQLRPLVVEASAQVRAARRLATDIAEPTASEVLQVVATDAERDCVLLRRLLAGALDALQAPRCGAAPGSQAAIAEIRDLAKAASSQARGVRLLARSERDLGRVPNAMLLEAAADNSDTSARLLMELGRYLARVAQIVRGV